MAKRLIVTNGDNTTAGMLSAGFDGELLPWRDMLHDGPVRSGLPLEKLSILRAAFLAEQFGGLTDKIAGDFIGRDAKIRAHASYDRIELWFEHDLYDQLQLLQLLDFFAREGRSDGLLLMQAADYLGQQSPDALKALQPTARLVTQEQFALAQKAWAAFTAETPEPMSAMAFGGETALPYVAPALHRMLQELPAVGSGLSLTEERCLAALVRGPRGVGALFKVTQEQEEARFLADLPFFHLLDGLCFGPVPLLHGLPMRARQVMQGRDDSGYRAFATAQLMLTDAGRAALDGRFNHVQANGIARWFGGTYLKAEKLWRRDPAGRLVAPSA
jgi:hypothetical protein